MRIIKLILFCVALMLICSLTYGQGVVNFGASRAQDTSRTAGAIKAPFYSNTDNTKFLTVGPTGLLYLATPAGGSGSGTVTSIITGFGLVRDTITTSGTIAVNTSEIATKSALDSVAGLIPTDVVDSAMLADSMAVKLSIGDSATRYVTPKRLADSTAAVRAAIPSVTGFVPYTGANSNVNLGGFGLLARKFTGDTVQASGSMGIHIHGTGGTGIMVGAGGGGNVTFDAYPTTVAGDSVLTTNSSGGLLRYNLKSKLANYLLVSDTGVYVATVKGVRDSSAALRTLANTKQNFSDTSTYDATRSWVQSQGYLDGGDTVSLNNKINARIPYSDTTNNVLTRNNTITIRNKRFVYTSRTVANYTTSVTIPADTLDAVAITAQAGSLLFNAPSGTPTNFQQLVICIRDNGTPRALTFNAAFKGGDLTLPTTTVANRFMYIYFLYNENDARWYLTGKPGGYAP